MANEAEPAGESWATWQKNWWIVVLLFVGMYWGYTAGFVHEMEAVLAMIGFWRVMTWIVG